MTTIYMTVGDLLPAVEATLKYLDGTTVDLTSATGVTFSMKKENGTVIINAKAGSISNAAGGIVRYDWGEGETDDTGVFYAEFVVSWSAGTGATYIPQISFPAKGDLEIRFRDRFNA